MRYKFNKRLDYKYHLDKATHCIGNIMLWMHSVALILGLSISSMAFWRRQYEDILDTIMLLHSRNQLLYSCIFQQNNDSKHISEPLQEWCATKKLHILKWPSQSLGRCSGKCTKGCKPPNKQEFFKTMYDEWYTPLDNLMNWPDSMPCWCQTNHCQ
jgi:hypothetical protein